MENSNILFRLTICVTALMASTSLLAQTVAPVAASNARAVTPYVDIRYRLETVDQDGFSHDATASTLRVRAGIKTGEWHGVSALIEGESINRIGASRYNDTVNGKIVYPVVADPTDMLLNQAYVRYHDKLVDFTGGRQAVNYDNQRWIGSVGWRQNDQTMDALRLAVKPVKNLTLDYGYAWRVNRVFGPDSAQGTWRGNDIHVVRASYAAKPFGTVTAYGYFLDLPDAVRLSSKTTGVRLTGEQALTPKVKLLYATEFAKQKADKSNPLRFSHSYLLIEPGLALGPVSARGGLERLSGDGTSALQTPLATLHAFNGWTDKFLTTPANGLRDVYGDVQIKLPVVAGVKGAVLRAQYHDYRATHIDSHYGSEWGAMLTVPVTKQVILGGKYGRYNADRFSTDTDKMWLWTELKL